MKVVLQKPAVKIMEGHSGDEVSICEQEERSRAGIQVFPLRKPIHIEEAGSAERQQEPWSRKKIQFPSRNEHKLRKDQTSPSS